MEFKIQILGIRTYFDTATKKEKKSEKFFEKNWRAPSVAHLFANIEDYLKEIPVEEQYNLYYTICNCLEESGRKLAHQDVIPFDIDGIDVDRRKEYIAPVCKVLEVSPEDIGILFSGNGLQFIVGTAHPFSEAEFFDRNRTYYKALCAKINVALKAANLAGVADPSVFSTARLMRLPLTRNIKPNKPERMGELYNRVIKPLDFDIVKLSGVPLIDAKEQITEEALKRYPTPDTETVLDKCAFLKFCATEPAKVSEAQWYGMLSITARLPDGVQISHELSKGHPGYSHAETEAKIEQALDASGPRTCKNINSLWGKCHSCEFYKGKNIDGSTFSSPIMLRSAEFIKTKDTGFHDIGFTKEGVPKVGKPNYEDLRKFFEQMHYYINLGNSKISFIWEGKYWKEIGDMELENFAQMHFNPSATTTMTAEFKNLIHRTNLRDPDWFVDTTARRINLNNGVLDIETMELLPHSTDYGFRYVLDYDYNPDAVCPRFDKFLSDITCGNAELEAILLEYLGYAFSGDHCWAQKSLILTGEGRNGKSTFTTLVKKMLGKSNYATIGLDELKEPTSRQMLDGKLCNLADETPSYAMMDSALFKNLVTGGDTTVRMLYKQPYTISNKCKFIFLCNELPETRDTSLGFFRRLIIVPFNQVFEGENEDKFIDAKLEEEMSGIFNRILQGYRTLRSNKEFTESSIVLETTREYRHSIDTIIDWFHDCVEVRDTLEIEVRLIDMYRNYALFAETRNFKPKNYSSFTKRLSRIVPGYKTKVIRKIESGKKVRYLAGLLVGDDSRF